MKKIFSLLLVAALMMSLGVTALAADESTDVVIEVKEDDYVANPFSGTLTGSDFWLDTRYGHVQLNNDGTFQYKVDKDNETLNAILDSGKSALDKFMLTFPNGNGRWVGRNVKIHIYPDSVKNNGYIGDYTIKDLDETVDGTILTAKETTNQLELRCALGRLGVTADGKYTYTHYSFMDCVQVMRKGWIREDRIGICALGSGQEYDLVIRTTGENDKPKLKDFTFNQEGIDWVLMENVLEGANRGDGPVSTHKFKWEMDSAKYGTFVGEEDGTFFYAPFASSGDDTDILTETFIYSYTDIDGDKTEGTLTINILPIV